eukprot:48747-Prorocentrum_minimum.AAC.3
MVPMDAGAPGELKSSCDISRGVAEFLNEFVRGRFSLRGSFCSVRSGRQSDKSRQRATGQTSGRTVRDLGFANPKTLEPGRTGVPETAALEAAPLPPQTGAAERLRA